MFTDEKVMLTYKGNGNTMINQAADFLYRLYPSVPVPIRQGGG